MYHEKEKAATGLEPVTAKPFLPNPYLDYFDKLEFLDAYNMRKKLNSILNIVLSFTAIL